MRVGTAAAARRVGVTAVGGVGKRVAVGLLEGVWKGGIQRHVRLVLSQVAELSQKAVLRVVLAVPRNQHRGENWKWKEETERQMRKVKTGHCLPGMEANCQLDSADWRDSPDHRTPASEQHHWPVDPGIPQNTVSDENVLLYSILNFSIQEKLKHN